MSTDEAGVFIRKIPPSVIEPAYLALEINPIGKDGFPMNKIGIIIRNKMELDAIRDILSRKKVEEILEVIQRIRSDQE